MLMLGGTLNLNDDNTFLFLMCDVYSQISSLGSGLDSMYHAMLSRVFDISRYGPGIVSMLRRVLVTVLICEEPVSLQGVNPLYLVSVT